MSKLRISFTCQPEAVGPILVDLEDHQVGDLDISVVEKVPFTQNAPRIEHRSKEHRHGGQKKGNMLGVNKRLHGIKIRDGIVAYMKSQGRPVTKKELARSANIPNQKSLHKHLTTLVTENRVLRDSQGVYSLPTGAPLPPLKPKDPVTLPIKVMAALKTMGPGPHRRLDILKAVNVDERSGGYVITYLAQKGMLQNVGRGLYAATNKLFTGETTESETPIHTPNIHI